MEAIRSSETSVLIRATRRHLPEDDNHHSHRRGNLKSYIILDCFIPYAELKMKYVEEQFQNSISETVFYDVLCYVTDKLKQISN
jgi:hypothetical protein